MSLKHRLKCVVRDLYARLLWYSGLHRLVDRCMPRRLTILAGHCVAEDSINADLPADMKIRGERLRELLSALGRHHELVTVGEGYRRLRTGSGRSLLALSLDDGYRDNATVLPGLLEPLGAKVTVFLETRALDERRLNWSHKFFWLLDRLGAAEFARRYSEAGAEPGLVTKLADAARAADPSYRLKLLLKYEVGPRDRERAIDALFAAAGGDERALCERLYMSWTEARALAQAGHELGGHTHTHAILSRLAPEQQREEVGRGRESLARELGERALRSFAYPFGRRWDYDESARSVVRESGFDLAVTTHSGTNTAASDPTQLARWMIDDTTPLHVLGTEAAGGFELLRRLGIRLYD